MGSGRSVIFPSFRARTGDARSGRHPACAGSHRPVSPLERRALRAPPALLLLKGMDSPAARGMEGWMDGRWKFTPEGAPAARRAGE